jgi:3-oxoacyl-[acyl-carrier protein] reductase
MKTPTKQVAIVTGASRGIGKAIALKLKALSYEVVGTYKTNTNKAKEVATQGIDMQQANAGSEADTIRVVRHVINTYGQLDLVVNNAGIDTFGNIETYELSDWNEMVASDLTSVFLMTKYAIPYLKKSDNACIVNISSRLGLAEYAEPEFAVYSALKAAVNNFSMALSRELKNDGIRVNVVTPVPTETDLFRQVFTPEDHKALIAKGKLGQPEDVASLVIELVNDPTANGKMLFDKRVNL